MDPMPDPLPGWPRFLSRDQAAAYVGVSARVFDAEVSEGAWPAARRRGAKAGRLTWDRLLLEAYADRAAGLGLPALPEAPHAAPDMTIAAAQAAAMRGVADAAARNRPKHRQRSTRGSRVRSNQNATETAAHFDREDDT